MHKIGKNVKSKLAHYYYLCYFWWHETKYIKNSENNDKNKLLNAEAKTCKNWIQECMKKRKLNKIMHNVKS